MPQARDRQNRTKVAEDRAVPQSKCFRRRTQTAKLFEQCPQWEQGALRPATTQGAPP